VPVPKYRLVANELRKKIQSGVYANNERLHTEDELASQFNVSRQTVRQALDMLVSEGLIYRRQGSGTFVGKIPVVRTPTRRIGVIATFINGYIFPTILQGIERTLSSNSYSMELIATNNRREVERKVLMDFLNKPIDGLLVEGTKTALPNPNLELYRKIQAMGVPIVFYNGFYPSLEDSIHVNPDEEEGAKFLVRHLVSKGCRRIGGLFKSDDVQGMMRYSGYISACLEAGIPLDDDAVIWHNSENKNIFLDSMVTDPYCKSLKHQDGFVCYNDEVALYLSGFLKKLGCKQMPLIASFDNSIIRQVSEVPFVSLEHPKDALGSLAAQKLLNILNGQREFSAKLHWGKLAE